MNHGRLSSQGEDGVACGVDFAACDGRDRWVFETANPAKKTYITHRADYLRIGFDFKALGAFRVFCAGAIIRAYLGWLARLEIAQLTSLSA